MGNNLCDLDLPGKQLLLAKAVEALPEGGALIVYDSIIDDDRRTNAAALLTSVAMVLQRQGALGTPERNAGNGWSRRVRGDVDATARRPSIGRHRLRLTRRPGGG